MNLSEATRLLQNLIAIPSLSGQEKAALDFLVCYFQEFNWSIEIITNPKTDQNYLILVTFGNPEIVFTTHIDVVPAKSEQFQPTIVEGKIYGRGSNDAKGILVSMIAACRTLELSSQSNFGLLVVFEEEASSDGSRLAGKVLADRGIKYLINGEPTEGKLATGHKGIVSFKLTCTGRNAHSGYPEIGIDANRTLISLAQKLYELDLGSDAKLGQGTINIGVIHGGTAANIIADHAELDVLIRVVTSAEKIKQQIIDIVGNDGDLKFQNVEDPITLNLLPGFETTIAAYFTDLPNLLKVGAKGFLYGPGNILRAHTDQEFIFVSEIEQAIIGYQKILSTGSAMSVSKQDVLRNYLFITQQIKEVADKYNRDSSQIKLLAVSKKQPAEIMQVLIDSYPGVLLGENYVQEFAEKAQLLHGDFKAHLIGPLQSNKVKKAVVLFDVIQSVSSFKLAKLISKEAQKLNKVQQVYLQVNISDDVLKSGLSREQLLATFSEIKSLSNIEILGLMTITKYYSKITDVLPDFEQMVQLRSEVLSSCNNYNLSLSMGMSSDYQLAVQAGADLVRVGTEIFGSR